MSHNEIVQSLRAEITKLQQVVDLLLDGPSDPKVVRRPGRPKGSLNRGTSFNPEEFAPTKHTVLVDGKARIAAAQKKRWAAKKAALAVSDPRKRAASAKRTGKTALPTSARKIATSSMKKKAGEGRRAGSTQAASAKRSAAVATRTNVRKNSAAKKAGRPATKRPDKQVAQAAPELQTTA